MKYVFAVIGIFLSFAIMKWREDLGNTLGNMTWMRYFGGPYGFMVVIGVLIFFWSIATLTGTEELLFSSFMWLIPGLSGDKQTAIPVGTF